MDQYGTLQRNQSRIVEVLVVSEEKLDQVQKQNDDIQRHLMLSETRSGTRDENIVAAILTLKNGETLFLGSNTVEDSSDQTRHGSMVTLKANLSMGRPETIVRDCSGIQNKVLDCLYFRQQMDRYETVNEAHQETYEWVVSNGAPSDAPWSPLVTWLESGDGCYWINGRAGSGKSTLMEHIFHDKRTRTALNTWVGPGSQLGIARFFFLELGTELQKSHAGLLRSLVYDILSERPYLMSVVMPELLRTASTLPEHTALEPPSYPELLRWFRALVKHDSPSFRLVFLDGIDEYDGSHRDLTDLIKTSAKNRNVRFLVSSRPIPVCVDAFGHCPYLHLHDLTKNDIRRYAKDHLIEGVTKRQLVEWDQLIEEIVDKSCGVFLWVVLRLDELPSDLQELYVHMLGKIPAGYRRPASEFFQIVLLTNEIQATDFRLSPIQLFFWSCLHMCKTQRLQEVIQFEDNVAWIMARCALRYASFAEDTVNPIPPEYLCELDKAVDVHWKAATKYLMGHDRVHLHHDHWGKGYFTSAMKWRPSVVVPSGFDSVMGFFGISSFFSNTQQPHKDLLQLLIYRILDPEVDAHDEKCSALQLRRAKVCVFLLNSGASPNESAHDDEKLTAWQRLIYHAVESSKNKPQFIASFLGAKFAYTFSKLIASFVAHGADITACWEQDGKVLCVLEVLEHLYSPTTPSTFVTPPSGDPFLDESLGETAFPNQANQGAADIVKFRDYLVGLLIGKKTKPAAKPSVVFRRFSGLFKISSPD
ncbi:hypothetical protein B0H66DRAFT_628785 [Apodospora peruviana]|uniref:Nephrocystin 3-like N-terminal domain-containing protein n=1 Tax=Apodospora peruviana TaxID=516989 RepID=A0AAE0M1I6_9PEZI|nr:hypothetical protein B0H66DRAFT_628785 [Apodospora peruviana]